MIRQALTALGPRTVLPVVLVGGAALALGALFLPHEASAPARYRLVLHAPELRGAFYLSAWNDGDVIVAHDASDHQPITFTRRGQEHDGCAWLGTERLVPIGSRAYHYTYSETILSCQPDARPFVKTPRTGIVTVEAAPAEAGPPTALNGIQPPGDLWNEVADNDCDDVADFDDDDDAETAADVRQALRDAEQAVRDAQQQLAEQAAALQQAADSDDE